MQSGIDTAHARIDAFLHQGETKIDVRPDPMDQTGKSTDFFGADGLSFGDVLDAINPLNHIPIVSDIFQSQTGTQVSAVSRMIGGALLGGPIGLVASLASVIFEDAVGQSPAAAAYAALTGTTEPTTELARAESETESHIAAMEEVEEEQLAAAAPTDVIETIELASLSPSAGEQVQRRTPTPVATAVHLTNPDKAVLDLYGASGNSAHNSYRKAQLLPYLKDVTTSKVL